MMTMNDIYNEFDALAEEFKSGNTIAECKASGLLSAVKKVYGEGKSRELNDYYNAKKISMY